MNYIGPLIIIGSIIVLTVIIMMAEKFSSRKRNSNVVNYSTNSATKKIEELNELKKSGAISEKEFEEKKKKLLDEI